MLESLSNRREVFPEDDTLFCTKCGAQLGPEAKFCAACGAQLTPSEFSRTAPPPPTPGPISGLAKYPFLPPYWQIVFAKFDQNATNFQVHWNWPAFFFGAFWYLVKGMPAKAGLYFLFSILTAGIGWLFLAIYAGLYGPWDYYLKEVRGKQLW